jgi:hypothetical protein
MSQMKNQSLQHRMAEVQLRFIWKAERNTNYCVVLGHNNLFRRQRDTILQGVEYGGAIGARLYIPWTLEFEES